MVELIEIWILAVIQGLTEWLPISSSGHLVITQKLLGLNLPGDKIKLLLNSSLRGEITITSLYLFQIFLVFCAPFLKELYIKIKPL